MCDVILGYKLCAEIVYQISGQSDEGYQGYQGYRVVRLSANSCQPYIVSEQQLIACIE